MPTISRCSPALALAAALVMLAGCAGPGQQPPVAVGDLDLSAYPPCAEQPAPPELGDVPGLVLPVEATWFSLQEVGPLTQVSGVVALTPLEVRAFYETQPGLQVLSVEDERVETEVLASDGTHRMFVKVQIVCSGGSNFTATVGAESDSASLPTPAGHVRGGQ